MRTLLPAFLLVVYGFGVGTMLQRPLGVSQPLAIAVAFIGIAIAGLSALFLASAKPLIDFLEGWQTGIGALIGLCGLVLVEAARAEAERRRAKDAREAEHRSLCAVVADEVRSMRNAAQRLLQNLEELEGTQIDGRIPGLTADKVSELEPATSVVLPALLPRLGSIAGCAEVLELWRAYAEIAVQLRALHPGTEGLSIGELARVESPAQRVVTLAERTLARMPQPSAPSVSSAAPVAEVGSPTVDRARPDT